jgi:hypothetical protein
MSLAEATHREDAHGIIGTGPQRSATGAAYFCDRAINALGQVLKAIAFNDVAARCAAVSEATEATTCLFLELDADLPESPLNEPGCSYDALLRSFVRINSHNDVVATGEAIGILGRLRDCMLRRDVNHLGGLPKAGLATSTSLVMRNL